MAKFLKKWGPLFLTITLLAAAVFGVVKLVSIKTKNVSSTKFSVGSVDPRTGEYFADDTAIYTKKLIECDGLSIAPDFDNSNEYQIFWYNVDEMYFDCTSRFTFKTKFSSNSVPSEAVYCRIVIYPSQIDDEGKRIEDFKVRFYEPVKYASSFTVKVNKVQTANRYEYLSLAREKKLVSTVITDFYDTITNKSGETELVAKYNYISDIQLSSTNGSSIARQYLVSGVGRDVYFLNVADQLKVRLTYSGYYSNQHYAVRFFDKGGNSLSAGAFSMISADSRDILITVPEGAVFMLLETCRYNVDFEESKIEFNLYKYLPRTDVTESLYMD